MQSVALIDYGSGNLRSAEKALQKAAASADRPAAVVTTDDPDKIAAADLVVLPGVGAFAACMNALAARDGVIEAMTEAVKGRGAPFLGICVGLQLLAARGLEFGETAGLGWIEGEVRRIEPDDPRCKVPHMGWNNRSRTPAQRPCSPACRAAPHMYFTHSFAIFPEHEARRRRLDRPRRALCGGGDAGQCGGRAVPPREVAGRRARGCSPTCWSGGRDPLPRHRPEGRPVRARGARRLRHRHGVQRRSRRPGPRPGPPPASSGCTWSTSTARPRAGR